MLCRIGLPSNTASPLAQFGESLRIELHNSSIPINRAIGLKRSCILGMPSFPPNTATLGLVALDYGWSKSFVLRTCCVVFSSYLHLPLRLESYPTDGHTHGQPAGKHINGWV